MNIRDLEYLISLAEYKHFRRAADACNVSQPTLSGQIRKLEDELGTILLERTSRKVLFTQAGLALVDQAKSVLREVKVLKEMASNQGKEMSGPLHVGILPTLGPYLSPIIVPTMKETFPELELYLYELQTSQMVDQLSAGQLDCGILAFVKESEPFIEVPLFNEEILLAVSDKHEWAKEKQLPISVLKDKELLFLDDGHCLRSAHFKATNLETLRNMVAANVGISLIPKFAAKDTSGVKYISFCNPTPFRAVGLIYRPGSPLRTRYERLAKGIEEVMKKQDVE